MDCLFCEAGWADLRGQYIIYFWLKECFNIKILFGSIGQDRYIYDTNFQTMHSEQGVSAVNSSQIWWGSGVRGEERPRISESLAWSTVSIWTQGGSAFSSFGPVPLSREAVVGNFEGSRSLANTPRGRERSSDNSWLEKEAFWEDGGFFFSRFLHIFTHPAEADCILQTIAFVSKHLKLNASGCLL